MSDVTHPENVSRVVPRAVGFRWSAPPRGAISVRATRANESAGLEPRRLPPRLFPHPQLDDMARGLSREQSKEKNLKKQGGNKGNTEGLTPQARAERCGTRFLVSFSRSLTRAHASRRFAPSERATPSVSRVTRPRVDPVGPDRSNPDDARPFRVQANDRSISRRSLVVAVRIRVPVDRVVRR